MKKSLSSLLRIRASLSSRSGVALLIVIGMLALLMISAVAFTSMMRIERAGASNFRHAITAREMATVAAYRFLGDIDGAHPCDAARIRNDAMVDGDYPSRLPGAPLRDDIYPGWTNREWKVKVTHDDGSEETRTLFNDVPDEVIFSVNANRDDATRANVLSERMMKFVPGAFRADVARARPEWIPLEVEDRIVGRYSYIALNTSGLLDINVVGDASVERSELDNPAGIKIKGLGDVDDATQFSTARGVDGFVTMEEVAALGDNSGLKVDDLENFGMFSYIPNEELVPKGLEPDCNNNKGALQNPKLYIGGDLPSRLDDDYEYADGTTRPIKDRLWEILARDDMLGKDFVGSDGSFIGSGENRVQVPGKSDRIQGFIDALCDYIDADDTPRNLEAPHVENTPMVSAVNCYGKLQWNVSSANQGNNWKMTMCRFIHEFTFSIGGWNPFGTSSAGTVAHLTFKRNSSPTLAIAGNVTEPAKAPIVNGFLGCLIPEEAVEKDIEMGSGSGLQGEYTFAITNSVRCTDAMVYSKNGVTARATGSYGVDIEIEFRQGGKTINKVKFKDVKFSKLQSAVSGFTKANMGTGEVKKDFTGWLENCDPRFNWFGNEVGGLNMNSVMQWADGESLASFGISDPNAVGGIGAWAEYVLQHPENIDGSGAEGTIARLFDGLGKRADGTPPWKDKLSDLVHFPSAPNKPLQSVGQLAQIPIAPYFTMRLYDHRDAEKFEMVPSIGYHRIYDFFTIRDPDADEPLRGLVNPNSRQPDVMTAVYNEMPVDEWEATPKKLTTSEASEIGALASDQLGGSAQGISDIGKVDWLDILKLSASDALKAKFTDETRREAVIRNAAGLLSTRQQSFLVLIRADAFTTKFGLTSVKQGSVLATAQAVALVWRDPVPDDAGRHPCFVQMLKIISNDED